MYETYLIQEIRSRISQRAGIKNITPSDCKHIAEEIRKTVRKNVSETTLKRFFGFAAVSHGFSKYTMSALSEYADYMQPIYFGGKPSFDPTDNSWQKLHKKIGNISDYVLREIRNRSGLPYDMTISRKFAQHDLEEFYDNQASFMCFIAHPGYGKTILLSHIIQKYFRDQDAQYKDSIVLFLNASSFFRADNGKFDLNNHLKNILSIPQSEDLLTFLKEANTEQNKFFLVIDGFEELVLNKDSKSQLFNDLVDFICTLDHNHDIKIIMSMRSTLWVRFYDKIRTSAYLKNAWFKGNYFNENDGSNVPPFTEDELQEIVENTGNENYSKINPVLKAQLKFPFHTHLYYQLREEDPFLNYGSNIAFYELISRFIQEKIFKSNHYTEKLRFIKHLLEITDYGQASHSVEKNLLIEEMIMFKNAYMELISDGILIEERRSIGFFPKEYISFLHPQVFEYFIYMELFNRFTVSEKVDELFNYIDSNYKGNANRFILLQWAVRHFIRTSSYEVIDYIQALELNNYERNYLVYFIAENLKYELNLFPEKANEIKGAKVHEKIIEGLSNLDYIDSCYFEGIQALIDVSEKDQNWVIYHTILSIIDILSLDAKRISARIHILNEYKELCESSFVNPLDFLELAYAKTQGQNPSAAHLIAKVEHLIEGGDKSTHPGHPDTITGVFYMLLIGTNLFYGDPNKASQLINMVYNLHPRLIFSRTPFATYMLLLYGIACARNK
ncbi:MAG: NACHT domain-containing protein, partial [Chryseobacterium sp.]